MEHSRSEDRLWPIFAVITLVVILAAAIRWSLGHPYGIHWDEALYINEAWVDAQRLHYGMILKLGGRILVKSLGRPPAYRLLADPFLALFGLHTTMARLVSLACFVLSSWFIYLAGRCVSSKLAGVFAVLLFCLSPEVVSASIFFGTDAPLYLATSAMLYYLFASWSVQPDSSGNWIGLGLAVGLGLLSKTSFVLIAFPALLFSFLMGRRKNLGGPRLSSQLKAGLLALCIAAPWWLLNVRAAMAYSQYARNFVRNSLGPPSLGTWLRWFNTVFQCLLGPGSGILILVVLIGSLVGILTAKKSNLEPIKKVALGICACAGVPIILTQLSGTNHLLRHISPAMIPVAISISILADQTGWIRSRAGIVTSSILFGIQLFMIVYPVIFPNTHPVDNGAVNGSVPWRVMARFDQWDWKRVQEVSDGCGLAAPKIAYLGGGHVFNPPAIQFPWVATATATRNVTFDLPEVTWLWRYEDGNMDWQKMMDSAGQNDVVLTAPHYDGGLQNKGDLDNQHNAELADRLSRDPRFRGPIRIEMGSFEPIEFDIFVKKTVLCGAGQGVSVNQ